MSLKEEALKLHQECQGKLEVTSKVEAKNSYDLSIVYTPGVAEPCKEIHRNPELVYTYTAKKNLVAVVSDGTAVLGLGDIGPKAAMPVMEGKAVLFKAFGGVDAFPICLDTKDTDKIVETVKLISPTFGGINLEDISAPRCFEIEERLKKELDIPVFHDDQHGTAIIVLASLINALKLVKKSMGEITVVVNGAGAAGIAVSKLLLRAGVRDLILCDRRGAICSGDPNLNAAKEEIAKITNPQRKKGSLADVLVDADVFIGLSSPGVVTKEMVKTMANDSIIFAMSNPIPEIMPDEAFVGGASIVGTGRSDFPNQVNNVLAFPGVFRGALDVMAKEINEEMKLAAAYALANLIKENELSKDYIIPKAFDPHVAPAVAAAVAQAAIDTGVARIKVDPEEIAKRTYELTAKFR